MGAGLEAGPSGVELLGAGVGLESECMRLASPAWYQGSLGWGWS